jgi:hypothetical protein
MGKIRYAYDTASGGAEGIDPRENPSIDPGGQDQSQPVRRDVDDPGRGPKESCLEQNSGQEKQFYIYYLRRPDKIDIFDCSDGQPFYVGKGSNGRYLDHRREAQALLHKPGRKSIKVKIIHKLWKQGLDFKEDVSFDNLTEQESFEIEIQAIEAYGRINLGTGCLANLTNGGEGVVGAIRSKETIEKLRQSHLRENLSPETIEKFKQANTGENNPNYGKTHAPESIEKNRQAHLGKRHTPESNEKNRQAHLGENNYWFGKKHVPESIEKMRIVKLGEKNPNFGKHNKRKKVRIAYE